MVDIGKLAAAVVAQLEPQATAKGLTLELDLDFGAAAAVPTIRGDRDRLTQVLTNVIGVGLAIAKLIVEAHAGRITATSPGLGQGSTFRIELPA